MYGKPTNRMEVKWGEDGCEVTFVDLTPEEYAAQPEPRRKPAPQGFKLDLSEEAKKDPVLRTMASECAIHGLSRKTGHTWGE